MRFTLRKNLILPFAAMFSFLTVKAQIRLGIKAGLNLATLTDNTGGSALAAPYAGFTAKIPVAEGFSIQPDLVYSAQGIKGPGAAFHFNYINVPILATYTLPAGVFFQTGPQVGFLLNAKYVEDGSPDVDLKSDLKSSDFAWAFGAGFLTRAGLGFNLRYNLGLSAVGQDGGTSKNNVFQFGIFILFSNKGGHQ